MFASSLERHDVLPPHNTKYDGVVWLPPRHGRSSFKFNGSKVFR